jgi:hypothetical protein
VATVERIIIIDCSSSRSRSRDNSKGLIDSAIVSAVVVPTVPVAAGTAFAKW